MTVKSIGVFLILAIFFCIGWLFKELYWVPKINDKAHLVGLYGTVSIYRDNFGIPHIVAKTSDLDAFFGLGYVQAQDRLWQMVFQRHVARGTLSELFGKKTINEDKFLRAWGFFRAAKLAWKTLDPEIKKAAESYTAGVNTFIQQGHYPMIFKLLGYKPKLWTVYDSIAWQKLMAWELQNEWEYKLKNQYIFDKYGLKAIEQYFPPYPRKAPTTLSIHDLRQTGLIRNKFESIKNISTNIDHLNQVLLKSLAFTSDLQQQLGFEDFPGKGSNAWVIAGKYTRSGKPLLANDVHLKLSAPSLWYLAELKGPHLHVYGASIPGLPAIIIGHNNHIAWGITAGYGNTQDLYVLPQNAKLQTISEVIRVKGGKPIKFDVQMSQYGPVINNVTPHMQKIHEKITIRWTALQPGDTTPEAFYKLQYAKNWTEFKQALSYYVAPTLNVIYADTDGNIGYYYAGKVPIRQGWSGELFASTNDRWTGYIPFKKLPHVYNPQKGVIVSANNKVAPDVYPYILSFKWKVPPFRAERVHQLLKDRNSFTVKDMMTIQNDTKSLFWESLKPIMLKAMPEDVLSRQGLNILKKWNGDFSRNSKGATIFAYWVKQISVIWPKELAYGENWLSALFVKNYLKKEISNFLANTLSKAMHNLVDERGYQENHWRWGEVHHAVFNELGVGKVPAIAWVWRRQISTPGGNYTLNVGACHSENMQQIAGPTYRQVIDLANLNDSAFIQTLGQSGNVFSRWYDDLMVMWRNGHYIKMRSYSRLSKIRPHGHCLILLPQKKKF